MPDNVTFQSATPATPPAGTVAATDEIQVNGTQPIGHAQYVKLVDGTPNGTGAISGDSANGLDVDVTRVQGNVATTIERSTTATTAAVEDTAASTTLLASNAARKQAVIVNDSDAALYVKLGATASLVDYSYFLPGQSGGQKAQMELPLPIYTGRIDGIWASDAGGNARVTELT